MPFALAGPRQYLTVARKLGSSAQVDLTAATYVTSLVELSAVSFAFLILSWLARQWCLTVLATDNNRFDLRSAHRSLTAKPLSK